jgi:hypothetical protein
MQAMRAEGLAADAAYVAHTLAHAAHTLAHAGDAGGGPGGRRRDVYAAHFDSG